MLKLEINNKDFLDDIIITEDTLLEIRLENESKEINIDVRDDMCLKVIELDNNTENKITYHLGKNSQVIVYKLCRNNSDKTEVVLDEKSSIKYYSNIMNYRNNTYSFECLHNGSYSESIISNHCVNFTESEFRFLVNIDVNKESNECFCNQDNKIIDMNGGKNYISPNLLVDNDLIDANHSAYIGKFKKDVMFYLMSRGILKEDCYKLLIKGFLLEKMDLEENILEEFVSFINSNMVGD